MPYHTISNIILLGAIVGIILLILRRLPQAVATHKEEQESRRPVDEALALSASISMRMFYRGRTLILYWSRRAWNFALEAKGLRHPSLANYRIRKIFRSRQNEAVPVAEPASAVPTMEGVFKVPVQEVQDERYHLTKIKEDPHDFNNYNALGQFYIAKGNFNDAQNVYEYLINRDAANATYYAKLAYCKLNLKLYDDAAVFYEKSITLDSSHPNRYYNLALIYKLLDAPEKAARAVRKALELEPHNQKYKDLLASVKLD